MKINKIPEFYMIFAGKLTKFRNFTRHLPEKCPNFTLGLCFPEIFSWIFFGGKWGATPCAPVAYAYGWAPGPPPAKSGPGAASVVCPSVRLSVCKLLRKSLLLADKWPVRHQTCTRWTPGQRASRVCSSQGQGQRSRDTRTFLDSWNKLLRH